MWYFTLHCLIRGPVDASLSHGDIAAVVTMGFHKRVCLPIAAASTRSIRYSFLSHMTAPQGFCLSTYHIFNLCMLLCGAISNLGRGPTHFCPASRPISSAVQGCCPDRALRLGLLRRGECLVVTVHPAYWVCTDSGGPDTVVSTHGPRPFYL